MLSHVCSSSLFLQDMTSAAMEKLEQRRYNISRVLQRGYGLAEAGFSFFMLRSFYEITRF